LIYRNPATVVADLRHLRHRWRCDASDGFTPL